MMMDGGSTAEQVDALAGELPVVCAYEGWFRRFLSVGIFPFTFIVFIGVGIFAMRHGLPPAWLSPLAVPPFIVWVSTLERYHPYVKLWNRDHGDLRSDLVHMVVSALITPQVVTWILTAALVPVSAMLTERFDWFVWPTHWPIVLQLAFALCISEFGGYWAHRLEHEVPFLWRFHAAHHGAARLYWLNAARFHPIDMALLAGAGFGPLILLGCPPETLAITLLFAGMHGTFQHANIHVKLGFLNWVFSMAELHRWHHSRDIQESSTNYSGHVLIWDIVFGTRFLPDDRLPPCDIGIAGMASFPNDYIEQLKSPFTLERLQDAAKPAPRALALRLGVIVVTTVLHCNICQKDATGDVERSQTRSNVRRFASERFGVWRCPHCKSIHAADDVDLAYYYSGYPFHGGTGLDWVERVMYRNMTRRLERAGLQKHHAILDYGCGSGALIRYLRGAGYENAFGYDQFSPEYKVPERLERRYDCIVSQDVIEHVDEPWELLRTFERLANPGALISIGTPNAAGVDLKDPEWWVHALHQPYHRHILSGTMLREAGEKLGWEVARYYTSEYVNTLVPFINLRFVRHYMQCFDNTMDVALDRQHKDGWKLLSPLTLWYGFFGYFHTDDAGLMVVFRKPAIPAALTA